MAKKEYPKWVETADKKRVIVKDKDEEIKVTGKAPKAKDNTAKDKEPSDPKWQ